MNPDDQKSVQEIDIATLMDQVDKEMKTRPRGRRSKYNGPSFSYRKGMTWSEHEEVYQRKIEAMYTSEQIEYMCNQVRTLDQTFFGTTRLNWYHSNDHIAHVILRQYYHIIRPNLVVNLPFRPVDWIPTKVWETMIQMVIKHRALYEREIELMKEMWKAPEVDALDKMERAPDEIAKIKLGRKKKTRQVRRH